MKQTIQVRLSQHLALTPQLQQSIRLLQLSTLELQQEVEQMLGDNPFLEPDGDDDSDPRGFDLTTAPAPAPATAADDLYVDASMLAPPGGAPGVFEISVCHSGAPGEAERALAPLRRSELLEGVVLRQSLQQRQERWDGILQGCIQRQ